MFGSLEVRKRNYILFLEECGYDQEYIEKALENFDEKELEMDEQEQRGAMLNESTFTQEASG